MTLPSATQYELKLVKLLLDVVLERDIRFIVTQNNPDPDAIASAAAMSFLCKQKLDIDLPIYYSGIIGRAENIAVVDMLKDVCIIERLPHIEETVNIALVDVQPNTNLVTLPPHFKIAAIIDQHNLMRTVAAPFTDIRPALGATSTILNEYLRVAALDVPPELNTALYYGIKTNTMSLGRDASLMDVEAYFYLQPRIQVASLADIENISLPSSYFNTLSEVLETTCTFGPLISNLLPAMDYPDLTGEVAEFLTRYQNCEYVFCAGVFEEYLYFSIRCRSEQPRADLLARILTAEAGSGGGRSEASGGKIPLNGKNASALYDRLLLLVKDFLHLPWSMEGSPLV